MYTTKNDRQIDKRVIFKRVLFIFALLQTVVTSTNAADQTVPVGGNIQSVIDSVSAGGGGTVTLAAGVHNISSSIRIKSNITLQGQGDHASTLNNSSGNFKMIEQDVYGMNNITIQNLVITGNNADSGGGIQLVSFGNDHNNINVLNVKCYNTGWGVHIKGATNVTVENCEFEYNGSVGNEGYAHNMYLRRCYGAIVINSKFNNSISANGINISYSEDIEIYNCEMSGNYFRGVRAADSDGYIVHDCVITNNGDVGLLANTENVVTKNIDWQRNCVSNNGTGLKAGNGATGVVYNNNSYGNDDNYNLPGTVSQSDNISDSRIACEYSGNCSNGASAFTTIEAEDYCAQSGIDTEDCSEGSQNIGWINNGDWCAYYNVDFGSDARVFKARIASNTAGGNIEIRLDSVTGTLIGTCSVANTGGWQNWETETVNISDVSGIHDLYLVFTGSDTGYLFNVNWFTMNVTSVITIQSEKKQQMRYGLDFERLWFWYGPQTYLEDCAQWSVVDCDVDYLRVAINCGYELEEGVYNLSAYTNKIIPMMTTMKAANPNIKFFASPRPLNEAESGADWQPYPRWITGQTYNDDPFDFQWQKCAEYLLRYLELMDSYGFKISYLDVTNEWQSYPIGPRLQPSDVLDIRNYLIANLPAHIEMPLIIAPSAWSCKQGASFVSHAGNLGVEDGFDIAGVHNTGLGYYIGKGYTEEEAEVLAGLPQDFADAVNALDETKEIWDTEVHGWKGTTPASEIPTSYKMFERIRAGFSGLNGWLAIGQTNQKHCYFLNYGSGVTRNVKYYIFQKLTTTSNYGYALDVDLPAEFTSTAALIRGNLLTIWVLNNSSVDVPNVKFVVNNQIISDTPIKSTQWHSSLSIVGQSDSITKSSNTQFQSTVKANSLYCFEVRVQYIQTHIADLNYDGRIDNKDYCILANDWSEEESPVDIAPQPLGDGKVDFRDLAFLVEYWLTATTIPPLPAQASNPNPPSGATDIASTIDLSWTAGASAISHDVYIDTSNPPLFIGNQTATTFVPGSLPYQTKLYWRIDEINGWGKTEGMVWSFTTMIQPPPPPGQASNPSPVDGSTGVGTEEDLSWDPGHSATSHDVHFGTSILPPFIRNQTAATFDPVSMVPGTTYYWRIDEHTAFGKIAGPPWSFTTSTIPPPPP